MQLLSVLQNHAAAQVDSMHLLLSPSMQKSQDYVARVQLVQSGMQQLLQTATSVQEQLARIFESFENRIEKNLPLIQVLTMQVLVCSCVCERVRECARVCASVCECAFKHARVCGRLGERG